MCVPVVELLCQAVMGQILVFKCMLSGTRGRLRLRLILTSIKWSRYSRTPALEPLARYLGYPQVWLLGARAHAQPGARISYTRLTGGKILPTHGHLRWGKGLLQIPPGSSSF
jgi:hypothetical protein